jgi:membrane-bound serine protease (ClpP class)
LYLFVFIKDQSGDEMSLIWWIVSGIILVVFIWIGVVKSIAAHKIKIASGQESLVGKIGTAKSDIAPEGKFYVNGEYWNARVSGAHIKAGEKAKVLEINSFGEKHLIVGKIDDGK